MEDPPLSPIFSSQYSWCCQYKTREDDHFECSLAGKSRAKGINPLKPLILNKTECHARLRAHVQPDGNYLVTTVILDHNHGLSPGKARYFRSNRKLDNIVKRRLELNDRAGIGVSKNFNTFVVEAGGYDNLPFIEKDCRNYIERARRLRLGEGDALAVTNYFASMQNQNASFYYVIDFDEDSRIRNLFWADARSRAAYESFGEVVTFDTTYLTNKYDMPFAPFVGVNHHGHSMLFGCGLICSEHTDNFVWLFQSWLKCMSGRHPNAIITDQCGAMKNAIEIVFPNTRHRWCLWHIMKKIPKKLGRYSEYESIRYALQNAVYDTYSKEEFEDDWCRMISRFNLSENKWLAKLYTDRHRWVPIFVKDMFWAGMSTTQRSESMNAFFYNYVHSKTSLKLFVEQYDAALRNKVEKEKQADFDSLRSIYKCITPFTFEKQFQQAYTNAKFKEVQQQISRMIYYFPCLINEEGSVCTFEVDEDVIMGENEWTKRVKFIVYFNKTECEVQCTCKLFEFRGILCAHSLQILGRMKVREIPDKYILTRWRKNMKRKYNFVNISYCDGIDQSLLKRYDKLMADFSEVAMSAVEYDEVYEMVLGNVESLKAQISVSSSMCASNQLILTNSVNCLEGSGNMSNQSCKVLSPVQARRVGRPQTNIKVSIADQKAKKVKDRAKKKDKNTKVTHDGCEQTRAKKKAKNTEVAHDGCEQAPPASNPSSMVNETGTQESYNLRQGWMGGYGMGNIQLLQNLSQGVPGQFWSGGYVVREESQLFQNVKDL